MKKILSFVFLMNILACLVIAQNVGIGTPSPNLNAKLHLYSHNSGLLIPRLTAAQRSAMGAAGMNDAGIMVFDSTDQYFYYFDAAQNQWMSLPDKDWIITNLGNDQYSGVVGNVGIGTSTPTAKLHVNGSVRLQGLIPSNDSTVLVADGNGNLFLRKLNSWAGTNSNNGLHLNSSTNEIYLGGNLVENTTIIQGNYNMLYDLTGIGKFEIQNNSLPTLTVTNNGNIGINTPIPDPNAILDIESTSKGILFPRMTSPQRDAIIAPPLGLVIYNIEDSVAEHWNGNCWLPMHQPSCEFCEFDIALSDTFLIINKTTIDTVTTNITVTQTGGNPNPALINLYYLQNLPTGASCYLNSYVVSGAGTATLTVTSDIFATPGIYPIAIQAICEGNIKTKTFYVQIDSCYKVFINSSFTDYDLQVINNLPTNVPICIITTIQPNGKLYGDTGAAFTTGNLHPQSQVGIINMGELYGNGGNGGGLIWPINLNYPGEDGFPGGDAISMTVKSTLNNSGFIFGGGGGGASIGFSTLNSINLPFPLPTISFAIGLGVGGGGGAPDGLGGGIPAATFQIGLFDDGKDATGGLNGTFGAGGVQNIPISIPVVVIPGVSFVVQPNAVGGNGGGYGLAGTQGALDVCLSITNIPIVGTINVGCFPNPPYAVVPQGGIGGYAIRRNGLPLIGLPDGFYQVFQIRGQVGP